MSNPKNVIGTGNHVSDMAYDKIAKLEEHSQKSVLALVGLTLMRWSDYNLHVYYDSTNSTDDWPNFIIEVVNKNGDTAIVLGVVPNKDSGLYSTHS